jgi:CBS domain-containing protein
VPLIKFIMTPFPYSVDMEDTVAAASEMMAEHGIRHLPVTDRGRPVGVVSARDVRRALSEGPRDSKGRVREIADLDAYIVELTAPLDSVVNEMAQRHIATGLVVRDGRLVGIFTSTDVFTYLGKLLATLYPRGSDDVA